MKYVAWVEDFLAKSFQAETVDVYIDENLEKENFSASSGI